MLSSFTLDPQMQDQGPHTAQVKSIDVATAQKMVRGFSLSGKPMNFAISSQPIVVLPEPAKKLSEAIRPVAFALLKLARALPLIGFIATGAVAVVEMAEKKQQSQFLDRKAAFVGTAQVVSKGVAGVELDTFVDTYREVRVRLADKKFASATAAAIAGAVEIGVEMIGGPLTAHAARELIRSITRHTGGENRVPNRSDTLAVCQESLFLKKALTAPKDTTHEKFTCKKTVMGLSGKVVYRVDFKP